MERGFNMKYTLLVRSSDDGTASEKRFVYISLNKTSHSLVYVVVFDASHWL